MSAHLLLTLEVASLLADPFPSEAARRDCAPTLTSTKWAKLAKTSQDTAARDIADLVAKGLLRKGQRAVEALPTSL